MTTDPFHEPTYLRITKFLVITLVVIGIAISAFSLSVYLTDMLGLSIPAANLSLAILVMAVALSLSALALRGRSTWKEVAGFMLPALVTAFVAFKFVMPGVYLAFFLAYILFSAQRWWRAGRTS